MESNPIDSQVSPENEVSNKSAPEGEEEGWKVIEETEQKSGGWYVGKYLGLRKHKAAEEMAQQQQQQQQQQYSTSSYWFGSSSKPPADSTASTETESTIDGETSSTHRNSISNESEGEESRNERIFVRMVRNIRNKFVGRRLEGMVYIRRVVGFASTAITLRINSSHLLGAQGEEDLSDLPSQCQRAITATDMILDSLERRSKAWEGVDFSDEVQITRGVSVGVSDPFLGLLGWSVAMEVTATVRSLLASRKRYEQQRQAQLAAEKAQRAERGERGSFRLPSFSFSFRGGGRGEAELAALMEGVKVEGEAAGAGGAGPGAGTGGDSDESEEEGEEGEER